MALSTLKLELAEGLSAGLVDRLHEGVKALAQGAGVSPGLRSTLELVVEELCTNVMEHSGAGWLELSLDAGPGKVWVRIRDDGRPFDAAEARRKRLGFELDKVEDRRMGLYMVDQLTHTFQFSRGADGVNNVEFELRIDPGRPA